VTKEQIGSLEALPTERPYPGISRQSLNTLKTTVTRYSFEPGAAFPLHRHPQEQLTFIESGEVEFVAGPSEGELTAGSYFIVPPDLEHSIKAGPSGATILAIVVPGRAAADDYETVGRGGPSGNAS
jgi:quercetin dioxygenase-like cupin family protein